MNFTRDNYMIFCFHWPSPIIVWGIFFDKGGLAFRGLFIFFPSNWESEMPFLNWTANPGCFSGQITFGEKFGTTLLSSLGLPTARHGHVYVLPWRMLIAIGIPSFGTFEITKKKIAQLMSIKLITILSFFLSYGICV